MSDPNVQIEVIRALVQVIIVLVGLLASTRLKGKKKDDEK